MKKYLFYVNSEEETIKLGYIIGKKLFPESVIALIGDLSAGKTTLTKGIAQGLNVQQVINSPTFTIIKEYEGDLNLYHMDVYRIQNEDLGFEEYFYHDGVTVIEWADNIKSFLPDERLIIKIEKISDNQRQIELEPIGTKYEKLCEELENEKIID